MEHSVGALVILFAVATAVAILARRLRFPYTVGLVVAGLALGSSGWIAAPTLTKDLLFGIFLPGLLFEAAFHLSYRHLRENKWTVGLLAVPGVAGTMLLTGGLLPLFIGTFQGSSVALPAFLPALVFGALSAATDPIAVVGLFRSVGAPHRLAVMMEGESLLNDGTAAVAFSLLVSATAGGGLGVHEIVVALTQVVGVGALAGGVIGYLICLVIRRLDEPMIEITLTTLAAYGSFAAAELLRGSGVIAAVVAGLLCGSFGAPTGMSPSTRLAVEAFWDYVAFALNSVVFLLIGFTVHLSDLIDAWRPILAAYLAVTIGRAALVATVHLVLRRSVERWPTRWTLVLSWGGLRGGLSMVLALALPPDFPERHLFVSLTFGVVLLSIFLQGLTMTPLLRALGLGGSDEAREAYNAQRAEVVATRGGLAALEEACAAREVPAALAARLRHEYESRLTQAEERIARLSLDGGPLQHELEGEVRRQLLLAERQALVTAQRQGEASSAAFSARLAAVDQALVKRDDPPDPGKKAADDGNT